MPLAPRPHSIMAGAWTEALAQGWKEQPSVTCCLCPGHHDSINSPSCSHLPRAS